MVKKGASSAIGNLIVKIQGITKNEIRVQIKKDLSIGEDIDHELRMAASKFGYYAVLAEHAESRFEEAEHSYKLWTSRQERDLITENGKEFKTVKELDRKLRMIPAWSQWQSTLVKYRKEARVLKQVAKSFEMRKDLIQSISANRRAENHG